MPKPRIGITCEREERDPARSFALVREDYASAVTDFGGIPLLVPALPENGPDPEILESLDGLMVTGSGFDLHPRWFGERPHPKLGPLNNVRFDYEIELLKIALERPIPILAICGGCQAMNVAGGGTLYQDIGSQLPGSLRHKAPRSIRHGVRITRGSRLARIFQGLTGRVNTNHHQAIRDTAPDFSVAARARDGVIEAIEKNGPSFVVGVQWHPEIMYRKDRDAASLFSAFLRVAKPFSTKKRK